MDGYKTNHLWRDSHGVGNDTNEQLSKEEMLEAENAQYDHTGDTSNQDDETAERAIDGDLEWTARKPDSGRVFPPLERPVIIPQVKPGLTNLFQRAWAPDLLRHDVRPEEWMQFVDHLNICKTASPPLQVLNLAGTIVGFVPSHYAAIAGAVTNVVAVGGMVAVARIRIARYLKRANAEYFAPRGLVALIVKQSNVHTITGQPPDAPMLIDAGGDPYNAPDVVERRMQAFGGSIAPLQYQNLPASQKEESALDQVTAKMNALKARRGMRKGANGVKIPKEMAKLEEERAKRKEEEAKLRHEAEKEIAEKPSKREKVQKDLEKELAKLEKDARSDEEEYLEKSGKGGEKVEKKVKRLMFIAVQDLTIYMEQQKQQP